MLYYIRLNLFKKLKNVKAHYFPDGMPGFMVVVYSDESQDIINLNRYKRVRLPIEFYIAKKAEVEKEVGMRSL